MSPARAELSSYSNVVAEELAVGPTYIPVETRMYIVLYTEVSTRYLRLCIDKEFRFTSVGR